MQSYLKLILIFLLGTLYLQPISAGNTYTNDSISDDWYLRPETTYEKFLPLAIQGDAEIQNFLGYMHFYGEGVVQDYEQAFDWFYKAAKQGNVKAQKNLAVFHSGTIKAVPERYYDVEKMQYWLGLADKTYMAMMEQGRLHLDKRNSKQQQTDEIIQSGRIDIGEKVYFTFCSNCHGYDGQALYPGAPSFSNGEILAKSDSALIKSIAYGKKTMPSWRDTLDESLITYTLEYLRARFSLKNHKTVYATTYDIQDNNMDGEKLFTEFCAGCHGFNGIALYVNSPSFALGERLDKSDEELKNSIMNGKNIMPPWGNKLSKTQIDNILGFIRTLPSSFKKGIAGKLRDRPEAYFRFRPFGETGSEWIGADPIGLMPVE